MELKKLKGLGEKNELLLNKLGIYSIENLLEYYPYDYIKYKLDDINNVDDKEQVIVQGKIDNVPTQRYFRAKLNCLNFRIFTSNKLVNITIFNRIFIEN